MKQYSDQEWELFYEMLSMAQAGKLSQENPVDHEETPPEHLSEQEQKRRQKMRQSFLTWEQLKQIPPPVWLVKKALTMDTLAWISGEPGSLKSFLAIDIARAVAMGTDWQGYEVTTPGKVLYVVAEGAGGVRPRLLAQADFYGAGPEGLNIMVRAGAVQMAHRTSNSLAITPEWEDLLVCAEEVEPVLIILDTQARCSIGLAENDAGEMGYVIEAMERLRARTGACVLTVHHTPRGRDNLRGSTALTGAGETIIHIEKKDEDKKRPGEPTWVKVRNPRQKDSAEFPELDLQGTIWTLDGEEEPTIVLQPDKPVWAQGAAPAPVPAPGGVSVINHGKDLFTYLSPTGAAMEEDKKKIFMMFQGEWFTRKQIVDRTGMTVKQVRIMLDRLLDARLLEDRGHTNGREFRLVDTSDVDPNYGISSDDSDGTDPDDDPDDLS